jgi:hypothetical protein
VCCKPYAPCSAGPLARTTPRDKGVKRGEELSVFIVDSREAKGRADAVPAIDWTDNGLISRTNFFGAKAFGEAGASAAPPAVMNAVVDALASYPGVEDLQMPARRADICKIIHWPDGVLCQNDGKNITST